MAIGSPKLQTSCRWSVVPDSVNSMKLAESGCGVQDITPLPTSFVKTAFRERKSKHHPVALPSFHVLQAVEEVSVHGNGNTGEPGKACRAEKLFNSSSAWTLLEENFRCQQEFVLDRGSVGSCDQ